jgi:hypothetical protein
MLFRAWGRSLALLFRNGPALIFPNLQASLGMGLVLLAYLLALGLKAPEPVFVLFKIVSTLWAWLLFSWLAYAARRAFEDPRFRPGLAEISAWGRSRGRERVLSCVAALAAGFWIGFVLAFYRALAAGGPGEAAVIAIGAVLALLGTATLVLNIGLASRLESKALAEWKAAFLMTLAFAPQSLGALFSLLVMSGAMAFLAGAGHWWGRLLLAPALALPVFGAALSAAFLVALSDEFLARSHGAEPPAYEPFHFKELLRPWR